MQAKPVDTGRSATGSEGKATLSDRPDSLECLSAAYGPHMAAALWDCFGVPDQTPSESKDTGSYGLGSI